MQIVRVSALPDPLVASTLYLVKNGTELTITVTGTDAAVVAKTVTSSDISAAVASAISALDLQPGVQYAADIAARDALELTKNSIVFVADATGDATVTAGSASYFYELATDSYTKVSELESLDVTVDWDDLTGKPSSTAAQIDDAVSKTHSHANKATLDKLGESGGALTFDGNPVGTVQEGAHAW